MKLRNEEVINAILMKPAILEFDSTTNWWKLVIIFILTHMIHLAKTIPCRTKMQRNKLHEIGIKIQNNFRPDWFDSKDRKLNQNNPQINQIVWFLENCWTARYLWVLRPRQRKIVPSETCAWTCFDSFMLIELTSNLLELLKSISKLKLFNQMQQTDSRNGN